MENSNVPATNLSKLDAAIAAAEARKASKAGKTPAAPTAKPATNSVDKARARLDEQARLRLEREERRAAKRAEREAALANRQPHMGKVNKAAERLPVMSETASQFYGDITANLSSAEIAVLAAHLNHHNRVQATESATHTGELTLGMQVRIMKGDIKFLGKLGTITKIGRIRCHVEVPGFERVAYLFTSDVIPFVEEDELEESVAEETPAQATEVLEQSEPSAPEATGTEG